MKSGDIICNGRVHYKFTNVWFDYHENTDTELVESNYSYVEGRLFQYKPSVLRVTVLIDFSLWVFRSALSDKEQDQTPS